jgi:hypothetical protein
MTNRSRIDAHSTELLKSAWRVVFVGYEYQTGGMFDKKVKTDIALIYVGDFPVVASCGTGFWSFNDIESATRSIRRHSKECEIIARLDLVCDYTKTKLSDFFVAVTAQLKTEKSA